MQNGSFEKVSEQKDIVVEGNRLSKSFCNYFSFGIDGQIGYSFDKLRTKNKLANFAVYGAVGALNQLQKPMPINVYVESLYETPCPDDDENYKKKGRLIFDTSNKRIHIYGQNGEGVINQEQKNILALNIDSYTGGTTGIWKNAKSILKGEEKTLPSPSDGLIEVVSFDSGLGIAMEKSIGGFSKKIIQSPGPLRYDFIRYKDDSHCTYLQIDGEFFRINHPKTIVLKKSEIVKGGKIRVLRKKENNNFFNPLINQIKDIQAFFG